MLYFLDLPNNELFFPSDDRKLLSRVSHKLLLVSECLGDSNFECRIQNEPIYDREPQVCVLCGLHHLVNIFLIIYEIVKFI